MGLADTMGANTNAAGAIMHIVRLHLCQPGGRCRRIHPLIHCNAWLEALPGAFFQVLRIEYVVVSTLTPVKACPHEVQEGQQYNCFDRLMSE